jgi:hypothetical protein
VKTQSLISILFASIVALTGIAALSACSYQWRDATLDLSGEDVTAMLDEAQGASGQTVSSGNVDAFKYRDQSVAYVGTAPSSLGPVPALLGLMDFSFLGAGQDVWYGNIEQARVMFLDYSHDGIDNVGLSIGLDMGDGKFTYYNFSGDGGVDGGLFDATLTGPNGQQILLETYDVTGDVLADTIHLKVYAIDANGDGIYVGKIATLVGYGT